ncbi:hypothetical protein Zmor_018661 [Zophobas morio]|uniref:THAP-type domain-containing protein n=1 Tax=Zophobas morio TaxID=2755281 RepID=A0AA38I7U7_9CUCU|nr:hypothetical protein Zmor_018661 [Zophobas morio]
MPFKCCVNQCKDQKTLFSFPKEESRKNEWLHRLGRKDLLNKNIKNYRVCELHFQEGDVKRSEEVYSEETGQLMAVPLDRPRLRKDVTPISLPSRSSFQKIPPKRISPERKRQRLECEMLQSAIATSIASEEIYWKERTFSNIADVTNFLTKHPLSDWTASFKPEAIFLFFILEDANSSELKCGLKISNELKLILLHGSVESSILNFFSPLTNAVQLENGLKEIAKSLTDPIDKGVDEKLNLVNKTLNSLLSELPPETHNTIKFITDQVNLLKTSKNRHRYSWETVLFSSLIHSISPHCYKFIQNSGNLILPSSTTIRRVCSKFSGDPQLEQHNAHFLHYIKMKQQFLNENDKIVAILLDEIHIKPYMDYKGGTVVGKSYNSADCATTAHVFMLSAIRSSYKDVAHILPACRLTAEVLHGFLQKIILELENMGFKVVTVVTDNNAINRKAMSFFSNPPQICESYKHPADNDRPLFFIIDTVHILKNIRNNWLNQKNGQIMVYPDFDDFSIKREARFEAVRTLHLVEKDNLLKYGYTLSLKALFPTTIERQNVKLVLQVFNQSIVTALRQFGPRKNLISFEDTAIYLQIFCQWWDIVNTKTLLKGKRSRNIFQEPLTKNSTQIYEFLNKFTLWLDHWKTFEDGKLTKETHHAISQSVSGLIKLSEYRGKTFSERRTFFV